MTNTYLKKLSNILEMLHNLDRDLNLIGFNETEKKIYYTIASNIHNFGKCNISDVIESSGFSRSTVYKAIKMMEKQKSCEPKYSENLKDLAMYLYALRDERS